MSRHPLLALSIPARNRVLRLLGRSPEPDFLSPFERRHQCIFFHIPKTGGISVSESLLEGFHTNHRIYRRCAAADPVSVRKFWKFAILRDPVDRFVSAYRFLASGGINAEDKAFLEAHKAAFATFEGFAEAFLQDKTLQEEVHFRPQLTFLTKDNQERHEMDFLGRFERLPEDFAVICRKLGVQARLPVKNKTVQQIPRPNISSRARTQLEQHYARDMELIAQA